MTYNNSSIPITSNYVITTLNGLSLYARILSRYPYISQDQKKVFLIFSYTLENIRNKWRNGVGKCLSKDDIGTIYKFGNLITSPSINRYFSHYSIYDRLAKIWVYLLNVSDNLVPEVITGRSQTSLSVPSLNLERLRAAKESSSLMIKTVIERNLSNNNMLLLDIPTILLTIMIRSEAHEYILGKILGRIQNITKVHLDIDYLLSVENKVRKGNGVYRPDTRAIRDATAHARFKIKDDSLDDFAIHFNNTDDGYSFQRVYSRKELLQFYQDYDRMTIITTRLLIIRSLYSFLNLHFLMD
jgi:hypothetical protein